MRFIHIRTFFAGAAICASASAVVAQQLPSATDSARMIRGPQARPELIQMLRQRLLNSGMTPEQIHARLLSEGYPEDLLDGFLPGSQGQAKLPTSDTYSALQELGLADSTDIAFFRAVQSDSVGRAARDSLRGRATAEQLLYPRDSLGRVIGRIVVRADIADSLARADSGYNIFGLEVFRSSQSKFDPNLNGPVDATYRLGPGDQLVLILSGDVETAYTLDVTREGFVVIPQVGQIYVANLTLGQLEDLLFTRLGRVYSGVRRGAGATTRFSVSVAKLRSNQVFVLGEVERPGTYQISSAGTAVTALYAAGGPTASGSLRGVQIKRSGQTISSFDLYDYFLRGDGSRDTRLETGDIVFVPPRGPRVRVVGEVIRPGTYEASQGETLADMIMSAGGFRSDASRRRVQIERILPPAKRTTDGRDRVTIDVQSDALASGDGNHEALHIPVEGGDVVRVFAVAKRVRNTISVVGNVWSPGRQGLAPGMTIADAIRLAGGPKPDVYLGSVLVDRLRPDSTRLQLRASLRDSLGNVVNDFALEEDDVVQLFAVGEFRPERYVAIGGAVRKPGRFLYRQGMTMRDLVLLAGGLEESAYLKEAEIARLPESRTALTTALTMRVPLDSTYLFERKPGLAYLGPPGIPGAAEGAPETELRPYDNVLILKQPAWELQRVVTISGEVRFPGQYTLKSRSERLADLVDRAGGMTSEAFPEGTVVIRSKEHLGRIAIDVPQALKHRNSAENLLLMDGDRISVPLKSSVVAVRGAVNAPNIVAYVPGKDIEYYINQAGGAGRNADRGRAFITQPSGKRETNGRFSRPKPQPGSLVIVPTHDPSTDHNWVGIVGTAAQAATSLLTIFLAYKTIHP